jgi:hypothetical protein
MADTGIIDLDGGVVVEKRGCGRPRGSNNKPKVAIMEASSSSPAKRRPGRPLGSKNKDKASTSQINEPLDVSVAHPNPPQPSTAAHCRCRRSCRFTRLVSGEMWKQLLRPRLVRRRWLAWQRRREARVCRTLWLVGLAKYF